jgi:hypothetical protein
MFAMLNTGTVNRSLTTADLNVPDSDTTGPCGLHAAAPQPASAVASITHPSAVTPAVMPVPSNVQAIVSALSITASDSRTTAAFWMIAPAAVSSNGGSPNLFVSALCLTGNLLGTALVISGGDSFDEPSDSSVDAAWQSPDPIPTSELGAIEPGPHFDKEDIDMLLASSYQRQVRSVPTEEKLLPVRANEMVFASASTALPQSLGQPAHALSDADADFICAAALAGLIMAGVPNRKDERPKPFQSPQRVIGT